MDRNYISLDLCGKLAFQSLFYCTWKIWISESSGRVIEELDCLISSTSSRKAKACFSPAGEVASGHLSLWCRFANSSCGLFVRRITPEPVQVRCTSKLCVLLLLFLLLLLLQYRRCHHHYDYHHTTSTSILLSFPRTTQPHSPYPPPS